MRTKINDFVFKFHITSRYTFELQNFGKTESAWSDNLLPDQTHL